VKESIDSPFASLQSPLDDLTMITNSRQFSFYSYDSTDSTKGQAVPAAGDSFLTHARPRYWLCIVVHALVVLTRMAMVLVWAFRLDHKLTFNIKHLSAYTAALNFITAM